MITILLILSVLSIPFAAFCIFKLFKTYRERWIIIAGVSLFLGYSTSMGCAMFMECKRDKQAYESWTEQMHYEFSYDEWYSLKKEGNLPKQPKE